MCIVLVTRIVDGELVSAEKSRIANYVKAKAFAEKLAGPGCIVCIKRNGKVLWVG